ncbi:MULTISPECIES: hypothetical protein [unclassified Paraburkholderia]|uniref:hypothetical protein n=1 Tax=unclassified Paraburkholderia TaxID=2615204 RepID=UPI00180816A1|nr:MULTISPECIES: hypothetical protein [unclassified Paraburkholderia]MBB5445493.1 hypothetical protein [Paraburkholderia sp. WSM4177]MBB5486027.1 hypothetical protein [Paraburkholderia sp. WSM4180]
MLCAHAGFALYQAHQIQSHLLGYQAHQIQSHLLDIKDTWMASVETISDLRRDLDPAQSSTLGVVLSDNKQSKDINVAIRSMAAERLKKDIDTYERLVLPGDDRQYLEDDKKTIAAFLVVNDELYNLATSDTSDIDA